jgi:hypothetical protein
LCCNPSQALAAHLEALKPKQPAAAAAEGPAAKDAAKSDGASSAGERALVEARVHLTGAFFRMDHHPMEARVHPLISPIQA